VVGGETDIIDVLSHGNQRHHHTMDCNRSRIPAPPKGILGDVTNAQNAMKMSSAVYGHSRLDSKKTSIPFSRPGFVRKAGLPDAKTGANGLQTARKLPTAKQTSGIRPRSALSTRALLGSTNSSQPMRTSRSVSNISSMASTGKLGGSVTRNKRAVWDTKGRLEDMESAYETLREQMEGNITEKNDVTAILTKERTKINELEHLCEELQQQKQADLEALNFNKSDLGNLQRELEDAKRARLLEVEDLTREHKLKVYDLTTSHKNEIESINREFNAELDSLEKSHKEALKHLQTTLKEEARLAEQVQKEEYLALDQKLRAQLTDEVCLRKSQLHDLKAETDRIRGELETKNDQNDREIRNLKADLKLSNSDLERERMLTKSLRDTLSEQSAAHIALESSHSAVCSKIEKLTADLEERRRSVIELERLLQVATEEETNAKHKLREEETMRRKLHNLIQELKGNIRVFCRVRPVLENEATTEVEMHFPDGQESKEIELVGPSQESALGNVTTKTHPFSFDRVFSPQIGNGDVFKEISQLVQSALDGYNVCIFCYGQTGSGKTYTMSTEDGMISRAVRQIYESASDLQEKGWNYSIDGQFLEIYNENINDLLGRVDEFDKKKHEIKHDKQKTSVTDLITVQLDSPGRVTSLLKKAAANRSVAATRANERSSRSHSVFILKLAGSNNITRETSEGTLNLIDLAGSERLTQSGSTGDRLKEAQAINKSLSSLGDVIYALGNAKEGSHIPYRNSKVSLTHIQTNRTSLHIYCRIHWVETARR